MSIYQLALFQEELHKNVYLQIVRDSSLDEWISTRHYLKSTPLGASIKMCFKDRLHNILGCMMWGNPTSRKVDQNNVLELYRMCFTDDTEQFIESKCLAMARKHIRKHYPNVKGLIAYSSIGAGHEGIIYKADNWYVLGETKLASWQTRDGGRTDKDKSIKKRWTRSP